MNITTKAPQPLKWVAFSVTFSVFLLVNFSTQNLHADGGIDPRDENQVFIEMGTCHTPNFGNVEKKKYAWEWVNSLVELLNQHHSLRHEEPYFKRNVGYRQPNKMLLEERQRGFFSSVPFENSGFWVHVGHYFLGMITYTSGEMRNDTHLISEPQPGATLQERWCSQIRQYPEAAVNEAIAAGNVSFYDDHYAHIRFMNYDWVGEYHLFFRNCQHYTEWVLYGIDTTGLTIANMWGFGSAYLLALWVATLIGSLF